MISTHNKRFLLVLLVLFFLLTAGLFGGYLYLPHFLESFIIPDLAQRLGLEAKEAHVQRVGLSGAEIGPVRLGVGEGSSLEVQTLRIDYSLKTLLARKIDQVAFVGLKILCKVDEKGISVAGLRVAAAPESGAEKPVPFDPRTLLPVTLEQFAVEQSRVDVVWRDKQVQIPFNLSVDTSALQQGRVQGTVRLSPRDSDIELAVRFDQEADLIRVDIKKLHLAAERFSDLWDQPADISVHGLLDGSGWVSFGLQPFEVNGLNFTADLSSAAFSTAGGSLGNLATGEKGSIPIHITLQAQGSDSVKWSMAPFAVTSVVRLGIEAFSGQWTKAGQGGWAASAGCTTRLAPQPLAWGEKKGLTLLEPVEMSLDFTANHTPGAGVVFQLGLPTGPDHPKQTLVVKAGDVRATARMPDIQIEGTYTDGALRADYGLVLKESQLTLPEGRAACSVLEVKGALSMDGPMAVDAEVKLSEVSLSAGSRTVKAPRTLLKAHAAQPVQGPWQVNGVVRLDGALMTDRDNAVAIKDISAVLPLQWPPTDDASVAGAGMLKMGRLQWQTHDAGDLTGMLRQVGRGVAYDLKHASKLFPGMIVLLKGRATEAGAQVGIQVPAYQLRKGPELGKFVPALAGYQVTGRIEAGGDLTIDSAGVSGFARLSVKEGTIIHKEQKLELEGIATTLDIIDPATLKSAPGQQLKINRLMLDNIKAEALTVGFQISSFKQFLVEKSTMRWCGGTIGTEALSLVVGGDDIDAVLLCREVNLAKMLVQLGVAQGAGDVTVNGRIPVRWAKGRLSFAKGFLTSPPGQSGVIQLHQIKGTDQVLAGLPPDTPQRVQLDIAMEALKDYTYSNVDLRLESEEDTLVFKLALDGKPNQPLPFFYDQELGQFKRAEGQGQAEFKGIGIDLNFRSPLNEILRYKDLFKPKHQ